MNELTVSKREAIELVGGNQEHVKNLARNMNTKDLEELLNETMLTKDSPYIFKVKGD
jgi:hypothetical protein